MTPAQKQNMVAALRELADQIEKNPGHLIGRDSQFETSPLDVALPTSRVTVSLWFIRAARLSKACDYLFSTARSGT